MQVADRIFAADGRNLETVVERVMPDEVGRPVGSRDQFVIIQRAQRQVHRKGFGDAQVGL